MSIDIREIELTEDQKRRIAELAEETGQSWSEVIDQQLKISVDSTGTQRFGTYSDKYIRDPQKRLEWLCRKPAVLAKHPCMVATYSHSGTDK